MTEDLVSALEAAASDQSGEVAELLAAASDRLQSQEARIDELSTELEETNEGMVALTVELQEAEQRFRSLFEDAVEGIYKTTEECDEYVMANPAMAEILGYDSPAALRAAVTDIGEDVFVDRERYEQYQQRLREGEQIVDFEYRIERRDGSVRWVTDNARAVEAYGDDPPGYRGGIVDITDRKRSQKELEQLSEKLATLNRVVRHDIRNDMQIIQLLVDTLEATDAQEREVLTKIQNNTDHVIELTTVAGEYADTLTSDDSFELDPVPLKPLLEREVEKQQSSQDATIWLAGPVPPLSVEANEILGSVFRNLLNNAVAHNDSDDPHVEVRCAVDEETVTVSVADDGPGVPEDRREAIFGKGEQGLESSGTGLGLYLVHNLVDSYGGTVRVEDRVGWEAPPADLNNEPGGAVFVVELQRA